MYLFTGTTTIYIFTYVLIQDAYETPLKKCSGKFYNNFYNSIGLVNCSILATRLEKNCHKQKEHVSMINLHVQHLRINPSAVHSF